jgi:hypothetical protein
MITPWPNRARYQRIGVSALGEAWIMTIIHDAGVDDLRDGLGLEQHVRVGANCWSVPGARPSSSSQSASALFGRFRRRGK